MPMDCPRCGGAFYDFFSVSINPLDHYWELVEGGRGQLQYPLCRPISGNPSPLGELWGFGGTLKDQGSRQTLSGRFGLSFEDASADSFFLSLTLDTATGPKANTDFSSWGTFDAIEVTPLTASGPLDPITPTWMTSPFDPDGGTQWVVNPDGTTRVKLAFNDFDDPKGLETQSQGIWGIGAELPKGNPTTTERVIGYSVTYDADLATWDLYAPVPEPSSAWLWLVLLGLGALKLLSAKWARAWRRAWGQAGIS